MPLRLLRSEPRPPSTGLTPLERQFLPPLLEIAETPPAPAKRAVLWGVLALVAALLGWACIGEIDVVATVSGRFVPDGKVKTVQPMDAALVRAIHVKEGEHVRQGDLLIELDPTVSAADLAAGAQKLVLARLERARLQAELSGAVPVYEPMAKPEWIALQETLRQAREAAYAAKLNEAGTAVETRRSALASAEATVRKLQETLAIAAEKERRARPYAEVAITRFEYLKLKTELVANRNELAAQRLTVDELRHSQQQAAHRLEQVQSERRAQILAELETKASQIAVLQAEVDKAQQAVTQKELRAPADGLVQSLAVTTTGGVVTPAQALVTIVPDGTPLLVEAALANDDVGFVKPGQRVEIKIDAFPFQKYGALKGTLTWISPDAQDMHQTNAPDLSGLSKPAPEARSPRAGLSYKAHIKPDKQVMQVGGALQPLSAGMTVQADVTTDRRRIIEFFLSPIVKHLDEGLKVR